MNTCKTALKGFLYKLSTDHRLNMNHIWPDLINFFFGRLIFFSWKVLFSSCRIHVTWETLINWILCFRLGLEVGVIGTRLWKCSTADYTPFLAVIKHSPLLFSLHAWPQETLSTVVPPPTNVRSPSADGSPAKPAASWSVSLWGWCEKVRERIGEMKWKIFFPFVFIQSSQVRKLLIQWGTKAHRENKNKSGAGLGVKVESEELASNLPSGQSLSAGWQLWPRPLRPTLN